MRAAKLTIRTDAKGNRTLTGNLAYPLERGAMLVLRRLTDTEFALIALTRDGRQAPDYSPQTVFSFVPPMESELTR